MAIYFTFDKAFSKEGYSDLGSLLLPFAFARQSRTDGILAYTRSPACSPHPHQDLDQRDSPQSHIVVLSPRELRLSFNLTDEVNRDGLSPRGSNDLSHSEAQSILDSIRETFSPTSYFSDLPLERRGITRFSMGDTPLNKDPYKNSRKLREIIDFYKR